MYQAYFHIAINIILIVAALNWGLVAYNGTDLVSVVTPAQPMIERYIKLAIGVCGLYAIYVMNAKHFS